MAGRGSRSTPLLTFCLAHHFLGHGSLQGRELPLVSSRSNFAADFRAFFVACRVSARVCPLLRRLLALSLPVNQVFRPSVSSALSAVPLTPPNQRQIVRTRIGDMPVVARAPWHNTSARCLLSPCIHQLQMRLVPAQRPEPGRVTSNLASSLSSVS
jgi:hypothetical protein